MASEGWGLATSLASVSLRNWINSSTCSGRSWSATVGERVRASSRVLFISPRRRHSTRVRTVAAPDGTLSEEQGWSSLVVTPERGLLTVDGLLTGWHDPESSHLQLLEAAAGADLLEDSYRAAVANGYRWHEFGDLHLVVP
jgi:S-adenosylmethionine:tRNA ribosyltransferase-isomerase